MKVFDVHLVVRVSAAHPLVDDRDIREMLTQPRVVDQVRQGLWDEFLGVNKQERKSNVRGRAATGTN